MVSHPKPKPSPERSKAFWDVIEIEAKLARLRNLDIQTVGEAQGVYGSIKVKRLAGIADLFGNTVGLVENQRFPTVTLDRSDNGVRHDHTLPDPLTQTAVPRSGRAKLPSTPDKTRS